MHYPPYRQWYMFRSIILIYKALFFRLQYESTDLSARRAPSTGKNVFVERSGYAMISPGLSLFYHLAAQLQYFGPFVWKLVRVSSPPNLNHHKHWIHVAWISCADFHTVILRKINCVKSWSFSSPPLANVDMAFPTTQSRSVDEPREQCLSSLESVA